MTIQDKNKQIEPLRQNIKRNVRNDLIIVTVLIILILIGDVSILTYLLIGMTFLNMAATLALLNKSTNQINAIKDQFNFELIEERLQFGHTSVKIKNFRHTKNKSVYKLVHNSTLYHILIKNNKIISIDESQIKGVD